MCFSAPSPPTPPTPPPDPAPAPQAPDALAAMQANGANSKSRTAQAVGPMTLITNIGGPPGLTTPPQTTNRPTLG